MQQILQIFRKDLRHFWPEALLCLLVTATFARLYPAQWVDAESTRIFFLGLTLPAPTVQPLTRIFVALVPISWFVLIIRLVQDECLVGERPYWFTRPCRWPSLLAAKLAFIGLFVVLPLAIAQAAILAEAGFAPSHYLPRLLFLLFFNVGAFVIPIMALATVTRTFLRASLTVLAICAIITLIAAIASAGDTHDSVSLPSTDYFSFPLIVLAALAAIVSQYASRRTWLARALLLAVPITGGIILALPFEDQQLENTYYTANPASIPVHIAVAAGSTADKRPILTSNDDKTLNLSLPLEIADVPYATWVVPDAVHLTITAADGTHWTSNWRSTYGHLYRLGTQESAVSIYVPRPFLHRVIGHPVTLTVSLALTQSEAGASRHFAMPADGRLVVPGFGICTDAADPGIRNAALACRFPFAQPTRTLVAAQVTPYPCPAPPATALRTFPEDVLAGELDPLPADLGLNSVWSDTLVLGYQGHSDSSAAQEAHLCPGSDVSITPYHVVRRARYTMTAANVTLAAPADLASQLQGIQPAKISGGISK